MSKAKQYLLLGILFLALGTMMLFSGSVSRTIAYGDFVFAIVFFGMSARARKPSGDDKNDEQRSE
ncbi:MAG: hypothetical protein IKE04_06085 [Oscillospiraceae bacterium]|nr:hypothetical protein [Oscillospiraceae bacterium]